MLHAMRCRKVAHIRHLLANVGSSPRASMPDELFQIQLSPSLRIA
jgi:hypothetical protein